MCCPPLSPSRASLPHVLELSWCPAFPNPILESQLLQSFSLLPTIPILALLPLPHSVLNPSLLQLGCKEARDPMSFFHVLRPSEVARYLPCAISEYRDLAGWLMTTDLNCWSVFIPRQILLDKVFSNMSVTWSRECPTQSSLLEDWSRICCSRGWNCSERFSECV